MHITMRIIGAFKEPFLAIFALYEDSFIPILYYQEGRAHAMLTLGPIKQLASYPESKYSIVRQRKVSS